MRLQTRDDMLRQAVVMYGAPLPDALLGRIQQIDRLASFCGGALVSRQVIAMVIEQYNREEKNDSSKRRV